MRVGQGFDVHRFSNDPDTPLVLGGVTFEGARGLEGHSDADVVCHAIIDALLGAAGLGDIGTHFRDDDPRWAGCDSTEMLIRTVELVDDAGWVVTNVDCTIVAEVPRISDHAASMQQNLREICRAPVSVKASRAEGLGALGRHEGIACLSVALIGRHSGDRSRYRDA